MGEARRRKILGMPPREPPRVQQAVISDIADVAKLLALEKTYCDRCGAEFPLWPPELLNQHLHDDHEAMFWPSGVVIRIDASAAEIAQEWHDYEKDTDLARRQNYLTQYHVQFVFLVLQHRCDLYQKLVAAGVIVAPAQG